VQNRDFLEFLGFGVVLSDLEGLPPALLFRNA